MLCGISWLFLTTQSVSGVLTTFAYDHGQDFLENVSYLKGKRARIA